ncbi:hypothetical protein HU200_010790 [Digitaria exilis]|uniref:Uncharacterized protein n=1 Tax=Digitaria exilis TaxID=1010633 RepID=A0A835KLY2_9POAL|nr:hypothetical protein HU200_010790 [Digitaria exilis]
MMQQLKPEDFVVVLDENGKDVISEQIADLIGDAGSTGSSRLTFCIGGPTWSWGTMRERADATIRLSSCGFESSGCSNSSSGAALQGMDYNKRTEISPLGICVSSSSSTAV